jgi:HK97 family phage prohead protease
VGGIDAPLAFARGSLAVDEGTRLLRNHDLHDVVGAPEWWADSPAAMRAGFRLGRSRSADEALTLAEDDVVTGLSVGAELLDVVEGRGGVLIARAALIREVSLVGIPAYRSARVGG